MKTVLSGWRPSVSPRTVVVCALISMSLVVSATAQDNPAAGVKAPRSFMPKAETQALEFLSQFPEYDGRGIVVAVLDTGVDPTAEGLRTTSDGKAKVIDIIDATGAGDVDMATVVNMPESGVLAGIDGTELKIPTDGSWVVPQGEIRLGLKNAFTILPGPAISQYKNRMRAEREIQTQNRIRDLQKSLLEDDKSINRNEILERINQLESLLASYDPQPFFVHCVTFHDGSRWRAVVDANNNHDLRDDLVMSDFDHARQVSTFNAELGVSFGIHIYDEGRTLSIVTDAGAHGTHVAGIIAAHYPDNPDFNGVAPGAQIVSIKIGDNRLGTMETMTAMERALTAVVQHKCHLINMSYGEPTTNPDKGRIMRLIHHTVRENNVVFVASAGNAGPALYTVGAPGGTTGPVFGIGAYISPAMATEQYGIAGEIPETFYTWSSRGPTFDGDPGVDFAAPGGAFAPVPQWSGTGKQQMNGTSMAAPNACGNIALILSGLKSRAQTYTPERIFRALATTARKLENSSRFAQGHGLIQTASAFDLLQKHPKASLLNTPIDVSIPDLSGRGRNNRGIIIYYNHNDPESLKHNQKVRLTPWFPEETPLARKVGFERRLTLKSQVDWITCPPDLLLQSGRSQMDMEIDLSGQRLPSPYFTEVEVFDSEFPDAGPVAWIPVSLIRLEDGQSQAPHLTGGGPFKPGEIERKFIKTPDWAQWAEIRFTRTAGPQDSVRFVFHSVQRVTGRNYRHHEIRNYISLDRESEKSRRFKVVGGTPIEVALAPYWSVSEGNEVSWAVQFFGDKVSPEHIHIDGNQGMTQVEVFPSPDGRRFTIIEPYGRLSTARRTVLPASADINPLLDARDELVNGDFMYELILKYPFRLDHKTSVKPVLSAFQDKLYEMELSSQIWEIRDEDNYVHASDDTWPDAVSLQSGEYQLIYHFRHPSKSFLEKLKNLPVALEMPISPVNARFFDDPERFAIHGTAGGVPSRLEQGDSPVHFYAGIPFESGIPAHIQAGDVLHGTMSLIYDDPATPWNEKNVQELPFTYSVPTTIDKSIKSRTSASDDSDIIQRDLENTVKASRLAFLKNIPQSDSEEFSKTANQLLEMNPDWIDVHYEKLKRLDNEDRKDRLEEVIESADAVISLIDKEKLARVLNIPEKFLSESEKQSLDEARKHKPLLVDALYRKCRAIAYLDDANKEKSGSADLDPQFEEDFGELSKWVNTSDKEFLLVHIRNLRRQGRQAEGLKVLKPYISSDATSVDDLKFHKKKLRLLEELGWSEWLETQARFINAAYPADKSVRF